MVLEDTHRFTINVGAPKYCPDYTDETSCVDAGCYWCEVEGIGHCQNEPCEIYEGSAKISNVLAPQIIGENEPFYVRYDVENQGYTDILWGEMYNNGVIVPGSQWQQNIQGGDPPITMEKQFSIAETMHGEIVAGHIVPDVGRVVDSRFRLSNIAVIQNFSAPDTVVAGEVFEIIYEALNLTDKNLVLWGHIRNRDTGMVLPNTYWENEVEGNTGFSSITEHVINETLNGEIEIGTKAVAGGNWWWLLIPAAFIGIGYFATR